MIVKIGSTRIVLLIGTYAFKFAEPRYFRNFLHGILANHQENMFWKAFKHDKLCPVIKLPYYIFGYTFIIMKRCNPILKEEFFSLNFDSFIQEEDFIIPMENKLDSFGTLDDRLVAVDYGN